MSKTTKEEIVDGLFFLIGRTLFFMLTGTETSGSSVNLKIDSGVFRVSLTHRSCSKDHEKMIQTYMEALNWFQDENEGDEELDFRHFV